MTARETLLTFNDPSIVDYYESNSGLQEAEDRLLKEFFKDGMAVLDIGVGAGRTTPYLAKRASRYVGIDRSEAMIDRCRRKFPDVAFTQVDATNLDTFADRSFDLVLFSFNGLGCLPDDDSRRHCLAECSRVLRQGGCFLFSLHNAGYLVARPRLHGVRGPRAAWRIAYSIYQTVRNLPHRVTSRAYWREAGYLIDPLLHGGVRVYVSSPALAAKELQRFGFVVDRCLPGPETDERPGFLVPWYYYACVKVS